MEVISKDDLISLMDSVKLMAPGDRETREFLTGLYWELFKLPVYNMPDKPVIPQYLTRMVAENKDGVKV